MTINRMGLTTEMALEISNERIDDEALAELIEFRRGSLDYHVKQGNKTQAFMHGVVLSALRELLAYRKDSSKSVADVVAWNKPGEERKCDIRWRRFDVAPGPLFAAPPLQTGTSLMKDHQIRELVNDLRDIAVKYHGTQQLRERIARAVRSVILKSVTNEP